MINANQIQKLDTRTLKWYRKQIAQFHQECLKFDKCYGVESVFHEHFKELEKMLTDEIQKRAN